MKPKSTGVADGKNQALLVSDAVESESELSSDVVAGTKENIPFVI
jgi:hypothetical protein